MQTAINQATEWVKGSMGLLQDFSFPQNNRNWLSAAYFGLCIRHQAALVTLFENNLPHSALALMRPQLEAFIRGTWVRRCAENKQISIIESTEADLKFPSVPKMIEAIESTSACFNKALSSYRNQSYDIHNDFTHGGKRQLVLLSSGAYIDDAVPPETVVAALKNSTRLGLLASIEMCALDEATHLAEELVSLRTGIYGDS